MKLFLIGLIVAVCADTIAQPETTAPDIYTGKVARNWSLTATLEKRAYEPKEPIIARFILMRTAATPGSVMTNRDASLDFHILVYDAAGHKVPEVVPLPEVIRNLDGRKKEAGRHRFSGQNI